MSLPNLFFYRPLRPEMFPLPSGLGPRAERIQAGLDRLEIRFQLGSIQRRFRGRGALGQELASAAGAGNLRVAHLLEPAVRNFPTPSEAAVPNQAPALAGPDLPWSGRDLYQDAK